MPDKTPEAARARQRQFYAENREKVLSWNRRWKEQNPEAHRESDRRSRIKNHARIYETQKAWRIRNAARLRAENRVYRLRRKYGLTTEQLEDLRQAQGGLCPIGGHPLPDVPDVDHDHVTGKVRGLLCHKHNILLGHFEGAGDLLPVILAYLRLSI